MLTSSHTLTRLDALATLCAHSAIAFAIGCGPKCSDDKEAVDGHCCWPGQRWSKEREACQGTPRCPTGTTAHAGVCAAPPPECPPEMVGIGATSLYIGTDLPERTSYERPLRLVDVAGFCIDRNELTVEEYKRCVDAGVCVAPAAAPAGRDGSDDSCNQLRPERANHPVNCVARAAAITYCRWAGKRLPSEAEWYLAAGRADGRKYPWGDGPGGPKRSNWQGAEWGPGGALYDQPDGFVETAPIDGFPGDLSPWGIVGMSGNVSEWSTLRQGRARVLGGDYSYGAAKNYEVGSVGVVNEDDLSPTTGFRCAK